MDGPLGYSQMYKDNFFHTSQKYVTQNLNSHFSLSWSMEGYKFLSFLCATDLEFTTCL